MYESSLFQDHVFWEIYTSTWWVKLNQYTKLTKEIGRLQLKPRFKGLTTSKYSLLLHKQMFDIAYKIYPKRRIKTINH